jgi:hypothetical protein
MGFGDASGADSGTDSARTSPLEAVAKRGRLPGLKLLDPEAGDEPEVAEIDGQDREAKLQRGDTDQQVGEGDGHALGLLLAVDLCGQQSGRFGVRIDRQIAQQFVDEGLAAKPHRRGLRAIDSVGQFRQPNG